MAEGVDGPGVREPRLLFADPWLLALAKPTGLLSQPGLGPELADSLITRAQRRWPEARLVHRLDRDTSGLLLLARDVETHRLLSAAFAERRVCKTYLALVRGVPPQRGGVIEQPLARIGTRPPRYGVVPMARGGKWALTRWRRLDRWQDLAGRRATLLLKPTTGRSHQLRAHLAWMGHPIVGDPIYGDWEPAGAMDTLDAALPLQLHAVGLGLIHPHTIKPLRLRSSWETLQRLGSDYPGVIVGRGCCNPG